MKAVTALLLIGVVSACSCVNRPFCIQTMDAVNLIRAKATASKVTDAHKIYALKVTKVLKGTSITKLKTAQSSAMCGLTLPIGVDYLIATDADGNASMCGPSRPWASLSRAERHVVNRGGNCDDCLKCGKYQQCNVFDNAPYCADFCAPGRCNAGETCILQEVQCIRAPCPPIAQCEACVKKCKPVTQPVCGSDAKTYSNECALGNAICADPKLKKAHDGKCKPQCARMCPDIFTPVCGSDGKTYSNECALGNAICADPTLTKAYAGECKPQCARMCPMVMMPVCGSDGHTYGNSCLLGIAICKNATLTKAQDGACGSNSTNLL